VSADSHYLVRRINFLTSLDHYIGHKPLNLVMYSSLTFMPILLLLFSPSDFAFTLPTSLHNSIILSYYLLALQPKARDCQLLSRLFNFAFLLWSVSTSHRANESLFTSIFIAVLDRLQTNLVKKVTHLERNLHHSFGSFFYRAIDAVQSVVMLSKSSVRPSVCLWHWCLLIILFWVFFRK